MNSKILRLTAVLLAAGSLATGASGAAQYRERIANDSSECRPGKGPAVQVTVEGLKAGGKVRVQAYRATAADWLKKGRWINRIESATRAGTMTFCVPVPNAGQYAIAVRHDKDGDGETDLSSDGGGMSNNPSINIFNLGKPSYTKTAFSVGAGVTSIRINMRYF